MLPLVIAAIALLPHVSFIPLSLHHCSMCVSFGALSSGRAPGIDQLRVFALQRVNHQNLVAR